MGLLGLAIYRYADSKEERFRTRTLAYFKSFSLPWFAILGAHKALERNLGVFAAITIGLIATTAGGVFIDVCSGVTPEILRPCEHILTTAVLASGVYTFIAMMEKDSRTFFPVTLIAVLVSFTFRVFAVRDHWPQIVPLNASAAGLGRASVKVSKRDIRFVPTPPTLGSSRARGRSMRPYVGARRNSIARPRQRANEVQTGASTGHGGVLCDSLGAGGCQSRQAAIFLVPPHGSRGTHGYDEGWMEEHQQGIYSRDRAGRYLPNY